jgi:hypothetical protein
MAAAPQVLSGVTKGCSFGTSYQSFFQRLYAILKIAVFDDFTQNADRIRSNPNPVSFDLTFFQPVQSIGQISPAISQAVKSSFHLRPSLYHVPNILITI